MEKARENTVHVSQLIETIYKTYERKQPAHKKRPDRVGKKQDTTLLNSNSQANLNNVSYTLKLFSSKN